MVDWNPRIGWDGTKIFVNIFHDSSHAVIVRFQKCLFSWLVLTIPWLGIRGELRQIPWIPLLFNIFWLGKIIHIPCTKTLHGWSIIIFWNLINLNELNNLQINIPFLLTIQVLSDHDLLMHWMSQIASVIPCHLLSGVSELQCSIAFLDIVTLNILKRVSTF